MSNKPISREAAIDLARASALAKRDDHGYLPQTPEDARNWVPHAWVVDAIQAASAQPHQDNAGFSAADMATASAQGFRDGVDSVKQPRQDEWVPDYVGIADRVQKNTGRGIYPSTVRAVLSAALEATGGKS